MILYQLADAVIFYVASGHHANMKELMAVKDDVAFAGEEAFGDPKGVKRSSERKDGAHEQQPSHAAGVKSADDALQDRVVSRRDDAAQSEEEEQRRAKWAPMRQGEPIDHGDDDGDAAQHHDR